MDVSCVVEECNSPIKESRREYCSAHLARFYKYGTATPSVKCVGCKEMFIFSGPAIDKHQYCNKCYSILKTHAAYIPVHPESVTRHHITIVQFLKILISQDFSCFCGKSFPPKSRITIDHDHKCCAKGYSCGKCVRGLLCSRCNTVIHHLEDNSHLFEVLGGYLERHKKASEILA